MSCETPSTGLFRNEREQMDYTWFPRYSVSRQTVQDRIICAMIAGHRPRTRRTAMFTSGTYGSGKTHALQGELVSTFSTSTLVRIDPDAARRALPEWVNLVWSAPERAGQQTHREATFIALLAERVCHTMGLSYLVDGSLGDAAWYSDWLPHVESQGYTVLLARFECEVDLAHMRCEKRARETGRHIPRDEIQQNYVRSSDAWGALKKYAYMWWRYNTDGDRAALASHGSNF